MLYIRQLYLGLTEMVGWWLDVFLDDGWVRERSSIMSKALYNFDPDPHLQF